MFDKQQAPLTEADRSEVTTALLIFLSGRPEDLQHFLGFTGLDGNDLRARLTDPGFQEGLLDYVCSNEPLLLAFCEEAGRDPAHIARLSHNSANTGEWM